MDKEEWRPVVGYEGLYEVSNMGNVRGLDRELHVIRNGKPYITVRRGKTLTQHGNGKGYLQVVLVDGDGVYKYCLVHRIVAMAFIPNPNGKPEVNHKDECKSNNSAENLEWCTHDYNVHYGTAIARKIRTLRALGKKKQNAKGKAMEMAKQKDMERIAHVLGVNPQTVRRGLEQGVYPFGCAVKCDKAYSYQFFPEKVYEFLGVRIGEDEKEN